MNSSLTPPLIGVSARIYHPDLPVLDLGGVWTKTLHYLEQSVALWLMTQDAVPVMVPAMATGSLQPRTINLHAYAAALDGLVLQGGADVAPQTYGEEPLRPEWAGDAVRDAYEIALIRAFVAAGKPVFGICRGLQILNVAFGGTLYQDLATQHGHSVIHFADGVYEHNYHCVDIQPGGWLADVYPGQQRTWVNSIHHQAIRRLAPGFRIEAFSPDDQTIEAISCHEGSYIAAVQWHPEFTAERGDSPFDDQPLLRDFLQACATAKASRGE